MNINIKQISIIVITIILFGIIIYFVARTFAHQCPDGQHHDSTLNKCIPTCKDPQINASDGSCECPDPLSQEGPNCTKKCGSGLTQCGNGCIDEKSQICIQDNPCSILRACANNTECCINGQVCDPKTDKCVDLKTCPKGQVFCEDSTMCCDSDKCINDSCCDTKSHDICGGTCCELDSNGQSRCCNGSCCKGDLSCDPKDSKCKKKCPFPDKNGNVVFCDGDDTGTKCFNIDHGDGKKVSACVNSSCLFTNNTYNPPNITDGKGTNVVVCSDSTGKLYSTQYPESLDGKSIGEKMVNKVSETVAKGPCSDGDCLKENSTIFLDSLSSVYTPQNQTCTGTFDCDKFLTYYNQPQNLINPYGSPPDFGRKQPVDNCPFTKTPFQCCKKDGLFTGQVCGENSIAIWNGEECICEPIGTQKSKFCSNIGTTYIDTDGSISCDCSKVPGDYDGVICQFSRAETCNGHGKPDINGKCSMDPPQHMTCGHQWNGPIPGTCDSNCPNNCVDCVEKHINCPACPSGSKPTNYVNSGGVSSGFSRLDWDCVWTNPHPQPIVFPVIPTPRPKPTQSPTKSPTEPPKPTQLPTYNKKHNNIFIPIIIGLLSIFIIILFIFRNKIKLF